MKKFTRFLSFALAAAITFTSFDVNVYAAEINSSAQEIIVADDASSEEETTSPEEETTLPSQIRLQKLVVRLSTAVLI